MPGWGARTETLRASRGTVLTGSPDTGLWLQNGGRPCCCCLNLPGSRGVLWRPQDSVQDPGGEKCQVSSKEGSCPKARACNAPALESLPERPSGHALPRKPCSQASLPRAPGCCPPVDCPVSCLGHKLSGLGEGSPRDYLGPRGTRPRQERGTLWLELTRELPVSR